MKQKETTEKGITLIALVITIIIMLILAMVTINISVNGGLFKYAREAKEQTGKVKILEEIQTAYDSAVIGYHTKEGGISQLLQQELQKNDSETTVEENGNQLFVNYKNYQVVLQNGEVISAEQVKIEKVNDKTPGILSGEGTESSPYLIESIEDLVAFSEAVNKGTSYKGEYVKLALTLDFQSDNSYVDSNNKTPLITGDGFTPIGGEGIKYEYEGTPEVFGEGEFVGNMFEGIFDGNGNSIRKLYINAYNGPENDAPYGFMVGLFGANAGTIRNLTVTGKAIGTMDYSKNMEESIFGVGGIAGINCYGTIENCVSYVSCESITNTPCHMGIGGIVAGNWYGIIKNCENRGNIYASDSKTVLDIMMGGEEEEFYVDGYGGIVGGCYGGNIDNCNNYGLININIGLGYLGGTGGIVGACSEVRGKQPLKFTNCTNYGKIYVSDEMFVFVGGFLGISYADTTIIDNCKNEGIIEHTGYQPIVAGFAGWLECDKLTLSNCKANGEIIISPKGITKEEILAKVKEIEDVDETELENFDERDWDYLKNGGVAAFAVILSKNGTNNFSNLSASSKITLKGEGDGTRFSVVTSICGRRLEYDDGGAYTYKGTIEIIGNYLEYNLDKEYICYPF